MPEIKIPLNTGIDKFSDGEELGINGNIELVNSYVHIPGKLVSRPYSNNTNTLEGFEIYSLVMYINPNLNYANNFAWLASATYNGVLGIYLISKDFTEYELVTETATKIRKIEILDDVAIFILGKSLDPLRYKYINKNFFDGLFTKKGWFLDIARPINNFVSLRPPTEVTQNTSLLDVNKNYFYKVVVVMDGTQISPLTANYVTAKPTANKALQITADIIKDTFNPRTTSLDIYRAESVSELEHQATYRFIKSISAKFPLVQSSGIQANFNYNRVIGDKSTLIAGGTPYAVGDANGVNDWIVILRPKMANRNINLNSINPAIKLKDNTDSPYTRIRMCNETGTSDATGHAYRIPDQPYNLETINNVGHTFYADKQDTDWNTFNPGVHSVQSFEGNSDFSADHVLLYNELRPNENSSPYYHSNGNHDWMLISRNNKVQNGHFLDKTGWNQRARTVNGKDFTPVIFFGGNRHLMNNTNYIDIFSAGSPFKGALGGLWSEHEYKRPLASFFVKQSTSYFDVGQSGNQDFYPQDQNNGLYQDITLENGKKYYYQYEFSWGFYENENIFNHQWFKAKLTKNAGITAPHLDGDWGESSTDNAYFFHNHGRSSYRTDNLGVPAITETNEGWWVLSNGTFTATESGTARLNFWLHHSNSTSNIFGNGSGLRIRNVVISEVDERPNPYYAGDNTVITTGYNNTESGSAVVTTNNFDNGKIQIDGNIHNIQSHDQTLFTVEPSISNLPTSSATQITISKDVTSTLSTNAQGQDIVSVQFTDDGFTALTPHPYDETPINVKPEFSVYIDGRLFVANCSYTSANLDDTEQDTNMVFFSELNQPNVIPITNFIKCQDAQGGQITGLAESLGNLIVFMQRSIWRLSIPTTDVSQWSLLESSPDLGCTATKSVISTEAGVFFANKEGVYVLNQNFIPQEISMLWREHYQANYSDDTKIFYSPKNKMLYVSQGIKTEVWVLDMKNIQQPVWMQLKNPNGWSGFASDESYNAYHFNNIGGNSVISDLESRSGVSKGFQKRTGWIRLGNLEDTKMIRRLNIRYKNKSSSIAPNLNIYIDGSETVAKTISGDLLFSNTTGEEAYVSARVGTRCKYFSIELDSYNKGITVSSESENLFELLTYEVDVE
mgnify:FL=1